MAAANMPYSLAYSRIPAIFESIRSAGSPPKFHNEFLKASLGFTSSNDRAVISVLRKLGFIGTNGEPTQRYNDFKGHEGGKAIAKGLREGWADLFMADQKIYTKDVNEIARRVATLTGANERNSKLIASTFSKLCEIADWSEEPKGTAGPPSSNGSKTEETPAGEAEEGTVISQNQNDKPTLSLHHDIHIHLPTTSDATVYRAVFQAIKAELL